MKPTFLKVGVPKNTVRPPTTVHPPTEKPGAANVPIPQFSHQKETPGPTHTIDLPDYAVGDIVFIAYQLNTTGHSVTSGWTALMGPTVTNGNELTVIARVMESGDGTTMTINAGGTSTCWANVGIVEANGATFTAASIDAAAAFWLGQNGASFNPPSVDASAAGDYFVFCGIFSNNIAFTSTTEPTNYTEIIEQSGGSPSHISTVAYRLVSITTSEDPGAGWGDTGGTRWGAAWTIAIPTSAGTPPLATGDHTHTLADGDATDVDTSTTAPVVGDILRYDGTDWVPELIDQYVATSTATVANTVTETTLLGSGEGSLTFPANYFRAGRTVKIRMSGQLSDTATPSQTVRVKLGGTTITSETSTLTGVSSVEWILDATITCRTAGASGTFIGGGLFDYDDGTEVSLVDDTESTLDTTGTLTLDVTWEWGTADAANTITTQTGIIT